MAKKKKLAKKKIAKKKVKKKPISKKKSLSQYVELGCLKRVGPRPYKKCIDIMVTINELIVDTGDFDDCILDELVELKKRLNDREREVITRLGASVAKPREIKIDEATPGSAPHYKI